MTRLARLALRGTAATILLIVAGQLYANTPRRPDSYAPFVVHETSAAEAQGRNIVATIDDVRRTTSIEYTYVGKNRPERVHQNTQGQWIVVSLGFTALRSTEILRTALATGNDQTSELRMSDGPTFVQPGMPRHRTLVFETSGQPQTLALRVYTQALTAPSSHAPLDSLLEISIPMKSVTDRDSISIPATAE